MDKYTKEEKLIMRKIGDYFRKNPKMVEKVVNIVSGNSKISISMIEWFVIKHAQHHGVILHIDKDKDRLVIDKDALTKNGKNIEYLNVYNNYKAQLKSYKKYNFDPFCRGEKIQFGLGKNVELVSSIRQLNYFKWACSEHIIDYIEANFDELYAIKKKMTP
jgi:hypothetical protein